MLASLERPYICQVCQPWPHLDKKTDCKAIIVGLRTVEVCKIHAFLGRLQMRFRGHHDHSTIVSQAADKPVDEYKMTAATRAFSVASAPGCFRGRTCDW